jgi:PadR family transcriptional regulator PadR
MGRNRRYYRLTDAGRNKYREYVEEWKAFSTKISGILEGGKEHEEG